MFTQESRAARRPWVQAALAATAGAVSLIGVVPATAAAHTVVNCRADPAALRNAIASAPAGATLRVEGTCIGPFGVGKNLTLIGLRGAVLDGNHTGAAVSVTGAVQVRLEGLTITHGNGSSGSGGGINNFGGTLTLDHSTVRNNVANTAGGGINNQGTLTLNDSTVRNNTAGQGGGIENANATLTLNHSTVLYNSAQLGGGIDNQGTQTLNNSAVRGNTTTGQGGGIENIGTSTLIHSTVERNRAGLTPGTSGGGIYNAGGTVTLDRTTVRNNEQDNCAPFGSVPGCIG